MSSLPDGGELPKPATKDSARLECAAMSPLNRALKDRFLSEAEAAAALGITVSRLHEVLDQHIFTNGNARPPALQFTSNDLLLLGYWCNGPRTGNHEVITMPKRR
jgi:hypothetical protein